MAHNELMTLSSFPHFVVLDFETANEMRASACQIGLIKMDENGEVIDSLVRLIKPDEGFEHFQPINVSVHGITPELVAGAPRMKDLASEILTFIGDLPVISHNMAFDYSVWNAHAALGNLPQISNPRLCTLRIARSVLHRPAGSNSLKTLVSEYLPGQQFIHHDAGDDARITGLLFLRFLEETKKSISDLINFFGNKGKTRARSAAPISEINLNDWPSQAVLKGESICFTGTLNRLKRSDAQLLVEHLGGSFSKGVTKKTTQLVVGVPNPSTWKPGNDGSSKMIKARELSSKGSQISVMTEEEFFSWIGEL